ncbi:pseudouridine synthase [Veillonella caviae]|uniref:pseudouridine synthase n=1 Tax=Veillonella caviae TaxID=248316 RepID=UPI0023F7D674|nr:pseudouridine synthase [Veillonella caviae]
MRLDKLLSNKAFGSRKEVHQLIKEGRVLVNGVKATKKDYSISLKTDIITVDGVRVSTEQQYYIKFHKPAGYVTAVEDPVHPVVMDLLPLEFKKMGVFPVGRLDKDTEGLLLLTNDGVWGHSIINGHKHVPKVYDLTYTGTLSDEGIQRIREGILLGDGTQCKPAEIEVFDSNQARITIQEGKYHQVKRMIGAAGGEVTYLKRLSVGPITLDGVEKPGQFTKIDTVEIDGFRK